MDDLTNQISSILSDPKSMEMIQSLASSLLGSPEEEAEKEPPAPEPQSPESSLSGLLPMLSGIGGNEIGLLLKIGNLLKSGQEDARTKLLLALRPLLAPERQSRVDTAVKLLKIAEILPLIRDAGIDLF